MKRGPKSAVPDEALIPMIREDLAASPFCEEEHRQVYYRMKFEKRIKVAVGVVSIHRKDPKGQDPPSSADNSPRILSRSEAAKGFARHVRPETVRKSQNSELGSVPEKKATRRFNAG